MLSEQVKFRQLKNQQHNTKSNDVNIENLLDLISVVPRVYQVIVLMLMVDLNLLPYLMI